MASKHDLYEFKLEKLDGDTVFIQGPTFNFCYTRADSIVKEEYVGLYRYFGGLQCTYPKGSPDHYKLEDWLCELAEQALNII
jgi:hypothetical protein